MAQITGAEVFNPIVLRGGFGGDAGGSLGPRFDSAVVTVGAGGSSANLFAVSVLSASLGGGFGGEPEFFDPAIGPDGSILLARIDYDIIGTGAAEFSFELGDQGIAELPDVSLDPTFGNATLTVTGVPEPSCAFALTVGCVAMAARRRKKQY